MKYELYRSTRRLIGYVSLPALVLLGLLPVGSQAGGFNVYVGDYGYGRPHDYPRHQRAMDFYRYGRRAYAPPVYYNPPAYRPQYCPQDRPRGGYRQGYRNGYRNRGYGRPRGFSIDFYGKRR